VKIETSLKREDVRLIVANGVNRDNPRFAEFLAEESHVRTWLFQKRSKATRRGYEREVRNFLSLYPNTLLRDMNEKHIVNFVICRRHLSEAAQAFSKNAISSLFSYLVKIRYLAFNPVAAVDAIRVPNKVGFRALNEEQIKKLMVAVSSMKSRDRLLIRLLFYTGLRVSEAVSLKWNSFFQIHGRKQLTVLGKGNKIRTVLVTDVLWKDLEDLRASIETSENGYVFRSEKDTRRPISSLTAWRIVKFAAKSAGLSDKISPHFFRHAFAIMALDGGAPIAVLQQALGHNSLSSTGVYLSVFPSVSPGDFLPKYD